MTRRRSTLLFRVVWCLTRRHRHRHLRPLHGHRRRQTVTTLQGTFQGQMISDLGDHRRLLESQGKTMMTTYSVAASSVKATKMQDQQHRQRQEARAEAEVMPALAEEGVKAAA